MADDTNTSQQGKPANQGNRQQQRAAQQAAAQAAAAAARAAQTPTPAPAEDKVVTAQTPADVPVTETPAPAAEAPVVEETPVEEAPADDVDPSTVPDSEDDPQVAELKTMLIDFVKANNQVGSDPKDFRLSAQRIAQITRFVIRFPKQSMLTTLLKFFRHNVDGVCKGENFLRGLSTLGNTDQQKVGFLYNLFSSMAANKRDRMEAATIIKVLEKSEFVTFFNRRQAALAASTN